MTTTTKPAEYCARNVPVLEKAAAGRYVSRMLTVGDRPTERDQFLMHGLLQRAIHEYGHNSSVPRIIRRMFYDRPWLFVPAALQLVRSEPDSPGLRFVTVLLLHNQEVISRLTNPQHFQRPDTMFYMRRFMAADPYMDIRLAKQLPGRDGAIDEAELPVAVRVLDVLDEISPGRRLIPILGYLTRYPDSLVAGKATMLIARRISNSAWIRRHMTAKDPRIRANVLEGLWGVDAPYARQTNLDSLLDPHNRVVGNALIGLHLARETGVERRVVKMTQDQRIGFRCTAAWVLGRMGNRENIEHLHRLLKDESTGVRRSALRALVAMRREVPIEATALERAAAQEVKAEAAPEAAPAVEPVPMQLRLDGNSFRILK